MAVSLERHTINNSTYHRMIETGILSEHDQVELIHGEIINTSPVGNKHASIVDRMNKFFNQNVGEKAIVRV